jgi:VanZ family protein
MRKYLRTLPMFTVMGMIFLLSHQPGEDLSLPSIPGLDKLLHALVYSLLTLSTLYAVPENFRRRRAGMSVIAVIIFCLLYGVSDEFHQSFIANRSPDPLDLIADVFGAALVSGGWFIREQANRSELSTQQP